jgi:hypothetical protein
MRIGKDGHRLFFSQQRLPCRYLIKHSVMIVVAQPALPL